MHALQTPQDRRFVPPDEVELYLTLGWIIEATEGDEVTMLPPECCCGELT